MLGKLKLTYDEVKNHPWDILEKIEKIIRGGEKNNSVRFKRTDAFGSLYHPAFGGISIEVRDENYKGVYRRVKVVFTKERKYEIDLDKIKAKYEEMKELAQEFEERGKKRDEYEKQNEKLISKLKDGSGDDVRIRGDNNHFHIEIFGLNEKEIKKVVRFVKTLKE